MERLNGIDARFTLFKLGKVRNEKVLWNILNKKLHLKLNRYHQKWKFKCNLKKKYN